MVNAQRAVPVPVCCSGLLYGYIITQHIKLYSCLGQSVIEAESEELHIQVFPSTSINMHNTQADTPTALQPNKSTHP